MTHAPIPLYLTEPIVDDHEYGVLTYNPVQKMWVIEGEPVVVEMAKRLFHGSQGLGPGRAQFPDTKRVVGDLNWLMLRFPLKVKDQDRWQASREQAIQHALVRREIARRPHKEVPPPTFTGTLKPYQEEALAYLYHNERSLLADEFGMGKTVVSLAWIAKLEAWPSLIVVQPHVLKQWVGAIHQFLAPPPPDSRQLRLMSDGTKVVHTIKGLKPYDLPPASLYITHYLLLRGWRKVLPSFGFRAVVFDEIQELRRTESEKYSAASELTSSVPHVAGLSATPIHNLGGEIWPVMNIIEYHCLGDRDSFRREWCDAYNSDRLKHPEMLGAYLRREGLMLRRTREEVGVQLPPLRRIVETIDFDQGVFGQLVRPAIEAALKFSQSSDQLEKGRLKREAIDVTRRATGLAKAPMVAAFVRGLLEAGETVLLFAHHHDVWAEYAEALGQFRPVRITGTESPAQKEEAIQKFIRGETNLVFIALKSSAGLDRLQSRARVVVFGELDWSPAVHGQAEGRAHREGQTQRVLSYYLVCDAGTDPDMLDSLGLKVQQFVDLMGEEPETEDDRLLAQTEAQEHMNRVIERLQELANTKTGR